MKVVGVGAGGHAKVIIDILRQNADWDIVGLVDRQPQLWQTELMGIEVLGDDRLLPQLKESGVDCAFIGVGSVGKTTARREIYQMLVDFGFRIPNAIHPRACVSALAKIGDGATVMAGAIINAAACLGANVIVNTGAIIEHDCVIGDHVHIATGACLSGGVIIEEGAHIGLGAVVRQQIKVGRNAVVGAGAVVVAPVAPGITVVGVPAKELINTNS